MVPNIGIKSKHSVLLLPLCLLSFSEVKAAEPLVPQISQGEYVSPFPSDKPELEAVSRFPMKVLNAVDKEGGLEISYELPLELTGGKPRNFKLVSSAFPSAAGSISPRSDIPDEASAQCKLEAKGLRCSMDYGTSLTGTIGTKDQVIDFLKKQNPELNELILKDKIDIQQFFASEARGVFEGLQLPPAPAVTRCSPEVKATFCAFASLEEKSLYRDFELPLNSNFGFVRVWSPQSSNINYVFEGKTVSQTCLSGSLLVGATFASTDLSNSDLSNVNLVNGQWTSTHVYNIEARSSNFSTSVFEDVSFRESCLISTNFNASVFKGQVSFKGSDLRRSKFKDAKVEGELDFTGARLEGATWFDGRICGKDSVGECL